VTASARVAGFDRRTANAHRLADPEFAADWDDALEASIDDLEAALAYADIFVGAKER
jgi:hypothetical protein